MFCNDSQWSRRLQNDWAWIQREGKISFEGWRIFIWGVKKFWENANIIWKIALNGNKATQQASDQFSLQNNIMQLHWKGSIASTLVWWLFRVCSKWSSCNWVGYDYAAFKDLLIMRRKKNFWLCRDHCNAHTWSLRLQMAIRNAAVGHLRILNSIVESTLDATFWSMI